jgi:hypothetical protein
MTPHRRLTLDELIDLESREIAKDILEKRLTSEDLPLPDKAGLNIHLDALLHLDPTIAIRAAERVEKRLDAYSTALKAIGIDATPIEPMKL